MQQVLCFGEVLLRMTPNKNWTLNRSVQTFIGGAEANVAMALAKWNIPVRIGTALPSNFIAEEIKGLFQSKGIDTSAIISSGNRVGIYYLNQGADLKSAGVVYDRAHSSFAELEVKSVDWDKMLDNIGHLHFTAITPALSQNVAELCEEMLQAATSKNITISLDLNYRDKLWKYGKEPIEIIPGLAKYCNIIMGNIWAANKLLGIEIEKDIENKHAHEDFLAHAKRSSAAIIDQFPKCTLVANTFRFNEQNNVIKYYATLFNKEGDLVFSKPKTYTDIIDKAGSGDCFMAGLLWGLFEKKTLQYTIDFAAAAATGKLYELGDFTEQSIENIEQKIAINE